jgi:uncharacterized protein involved in exopolysaccharide biosynthesis
VREYVDQNLEVKTQGTQNMLEWLDRELGNQQKKVQESEAALANYREKQNAMSLDDKQNIVVSRLNKLADDVVVAKTKKARAQVLWDQLRSATPSQMAEIVTIAQSPPVSAAKGKVQDAQRERARLADRYGEKHPELLKANAALSESQRQYDLEVQRAAQAIKNEYDTAVLEEQTFTQNLNAARADAQDLSRRASTTTSWNARRTATARSTALLQRENELRVAGTAGRTM